MKKALLFGLLLAAMVLFAACGGDSAPETATDTAGQAESAPAATSETANMGDYTVVIKDAAVFNSEYDGRCLAVQYNFTNNSDETVSADLAVYPKGFQDGIELEKSFWGGLPNGWSADNSIKEIRPGATIDCACAFILTSDADVEVEITELFALTDSGMAYKVFKIAEL